MEQVIPTPWTPGCSGFEAALQRVLQLGALGYGSDGPDAIKARAFVEHLLLDGRGHGFAHTDVLTTRLARSPLDARTTALASDLLQRVGQRKFALLCVLYAL